jgi:hypothetical protein
VKGKYTLRLVLIGCMGFPLLFVNALWAGVALRAYLLTALLFGALLAGDYPPFGGRWFWKAVLPIAVMHSFVVFGLVIVGLEFPEVNGLPRLVYGFLAVILVGEWRLSLRIIEACRAKEAHGSSSGR